MREKTFNSFWRRERKHLVALLKSLKKDIADDYRGSGEDNLPSFDITISMNEEATHWSYQTGDNSFTGNCYGHPYWGIGTVYRTSNCEELSKELIQSLSEAIPNWED